MEVFGRCENSGLLRKKVGKNNTLKRMDRMEETWRSGQILRFPF